MLGRNYQRRMSHVPTRMKVNCLSQVFFEFPTCFAFQHTHRFFQRARDANVCEHSIAKQLWINVGDCQAGRQGLGGVSSVSFALDP